MAFTITTDLTNITTAETTTGWTTYGAGGAGALALEPDYFAQGANCISRGVTGASTNKGMSFDIGAGNVLNFTTTHAGKLVYIWMRTSTPGLTDTRANGGIRIVLGSGATAPADAAGVWSAWYVDGSDTIAATDGWKCYVIDPTLPPSTTLGGGVDPTAIRWFGGIMRSTGTVKGQNFGIDRISYGLGELRVYGTNTNPGAGFKEMAAWDFGDITNGRFGILVEKEGVFLCKGKLVIGDGVSTNSTDFTSQNETILWEQPTYYDGTRQRNCVQDINYNTGLSYFGVDFRGNGTGNTTVTFGVKVGSGATASGRSGSSFIGSRIRTAFDFDDGSVETTLIYGCSFRRIRGGVDMSANDAADEFIGNTLTQCGALQPGPVEVKACNFIEELGGAYRFIEDFKNDGVAVQTLSPADPSTNWIEILNGADWEVPVGVEYVQLVDPGASDRRNVVLVGAPDTGLAGLQINVVAAAKTFTRTTGSYLTDGFQIGQSVLFSGFTNGGNNTTQVILSLTATVLTTVDGTGLVNETGSGDERGAGRPSITALTGDHYAEAIINWPTAGANQTAYGVIIRASENQEDYYYLKCDIIAQTITLIRCDAATDTTVDGPDSYAFAEGTDYLIQLIGRGTLIEAFVNGTKLTATSSTHQTNLFVGVRSDAEADQTGDAPRMARFGAGPITDKLGAVALTSSNDDLGYSKFINCARGVSLQSTGTYDFTGVTFSGGLVDLRDDSSGATTVNVTSGDTPTNKEAVDDAATTVVSAVSVTITVIDPDGDPIQNAQTSVHLAASPFTQVMNEDTNASGIATESYTGSVPVSVVVRVRKSEAADTPRYIPFSSTQTISTSGLTLTVTLKPTSLPL